MSANIRTSDIIETSETQKKGKLDGYVVTVDIGSWSFFFFLLKACPKKMDMVVISWNGYSCYLKVMNLNLIY